MAELTTDIRYIKGIGEQRAKSLKKLGINDLRGLITYFPRTYEDRREIKSIKDIVTDEIVTVKGTVTAPAKLSHVRRGLDLVKVKVFDDTGSLSLTFFNQAYVRDMLEQGETFYFYGKVGGSVLRPDMTNPVFEKEGMEGKVTCRIVPVYRLTAGVSQKVIIGAMAQGLEACKDTFPEPIPESVRKEHSLAQAGFAYRNIHLPKDFESLDIARNRLIFEEFFILAAALKMMKDRRVDKEGMKMQEQDLASFYDGLKFSLTGAQQRTIDEVIGDMMRDKPMSRLVQGDVGSGKTVIGAAAAYFAYLNGYQTAFMAPTEILAEQHYNTLSSMLSHLGMRVGLVTGSLTAKNRREINELIKQGYFHLIVGTHALISNNADYSNLGLVIADEQHRFGVNQRSALSEKGKNPHVLVMSATPIPRTLALIIYGDLDISVIDELPPGRQMVDTFAVGEDKRQRIFKFTQKLINEGRQAYFVCPMIDESEEAPTSANELKSVKEYAKHLELVMPKMRIGVIHGKMKPKEKEAVMSGFSAGELDILVSTTVIEVGVDVPNASLMVIENAERFGLSQLHQLRGRVGRGQHKSYCILFSSSHSEDTKARLDIMCKTGDGFKIAEEDLKIRGPGDFFGSRQHGLPEMKIADLSYDMAVLKTAQNAAEKLIDEDSELQKAENQKLRERIDEIFYENFHTFS